MRILVVIDKFTRECLVIEAARSFTAQDVIVTLQYLFAVRGGLGGVAWCVSGRGYAPPPDTPRGLSPYSLMSTGTETGRGHLGTCSRSICIV